MQGNFCRYRPLYQIFMFLFPKLSSCCKEAEDNLPTEGMSRPGGVAAKCHQHLYWAVISTASADGELIVEKWKSIRKAHPEPSQGPWQQASEVCSFNTERETSREEVDQTRCDRVPVLPYIITCWPVCLKGPRPGHACGSFHNEGLH